MPTRFLSVLGLCLATMLAFIAEPAAASYPCPGGAGPGEVQVGVTGGSHGIAATPVCERSGGGGGGDGGGGVYYSYGAIAWHRDATDVWMFGNWDSPFVAEREALDACNQAMGGGCTSAGEWNNSSMTIFRDRTGLLWNAWNGQGGAMRKRVLAECNAKQQIPCEVLATFSSSKRRYLPNPSARKLYAAAAWVAGTEGFDSRLYIASGHPDAQVALDTAQGACAKATGRTCEILALSGGGFIQAYRLGTDDNSATIETNAKRAALAARALCKKRGQACTLQRAYDSRTPGLFVHDFLAAPGK